jgi:VanZ family protein
MTRVFELLGRLRAVGWKVRWSVWLLYVVPWSAALLTPHPVRAARVLLPTGLAFLSAKLLHFTAYAGLAVLSAWLRVPSRFRGLFYAVLFAHAAATELLQTFVPLRHPSVRDVAIDSLGLVAGLSLSWGVSLLRRYREAIPWSADSRCSRLTEPSR